MKIFIDISFALALVFTSAWANASIVMPPDYEVAHSDAVSIIKITSGKCLVEDCASLISDEKHLEAGFVEYRFICKRPLAGNCPDITRTIPDASRIREFCIACNYIAFSRKGRIVLLLELREDDTRVVVDGHAFEQAIAIHDSGLPATSKRAYQYYELTDFLEAVNSIKARYKQAQWQ